MKEELSEKLGEELVPVLCVADEWEVVQRESAAEPESGAGGENLSYVIYTSGFDGASERSRNHAPRAEQSGGGAGAEVRA